MRALRLGTRSWHPYALAVLIFAAALLARIALDAVLPGLLPFITFFPAVLIAAYFCGVGPGAMVLVAGALSGMMWVDAPANDGVVRVLSLLLFVSLSGVCLALIHQLLQANASLRARDAQLELINRELKHRIKNLFSITNSICLQTINGGGPIEEMSRSVTGRIFALAAAQDFLGVSAQKGVEVSDLVNALVKTLAPAPARLTIRGDAAEIPAEAATPFALILHELGTNALKYGAWSAVTGRVSVEWRVEQPGKERQLNFE
jgi:two-component sensor histidine kinase